MWGIFLESLVIFQNYAGWSENHFLVGLYLFFLLYLWLTEKDRVIKAILVAAPTVLLVLFFVPLFRKAFVGVLDDGETYYRLLWLLQMSIVTAYGAVRLMGRFRKIGLVVMCVIVLACGSYVYNGTYISKAENAYHLPAEAVEVAQILDPGEGEKNVTGWFPADLVYYIRQYTTRINQPYGREMLIARWAYHNDMYDAMEKAEVIDTPAFVELARDYGCDYIVLTKTKQLSAPLTDYDYALYAETETYLIYADVLQND